MRLHYIPTCLLVVKIAILLPFFTKAQEVKVGLYRSLELRTVVFKVIEGQYTVSNNDSALVTMQPSDILFVTSVADRLSSWNSAAHLGLHSTMSITATKDNSRMLIEPAYPAAPPRRYYGNFNIWLDSVNRMTLVNQLSMDEYIAGVVEAESGIKALPEFYKAQAIISRTYLLNNLHRHKNENFDICDEVHCQVYKGYGVEHKPILKAVEETKGLVIVDKQGLLITAAFHANSGGQTVNSEDVWSTTLPYLRGKEDPYYEKLNHSSWTTEIPVTQWHDFLRSRNISFDPNKPLSFQQPKRQRFMVINNQPIMLTDIRNAFNLKSTFFSIEQKGNVLIFKGKGFGHGVGMSQESAMKMAQKGKSFQEIINFFYTNVQIVDIFETTYLQNMIFETR